MLLYQVFGALNAGYQSAWLDPNIAEYVATLTDFYLATPHVRGWWGRQRGTLPEPFRSYVDARLRELTGDAE